MAININIPTTSTLIAGFSPYYLEFDSSVSNYTRADLFIKDASFNLITSVSLLPDSNGDFKYNLSGVVKATVREYNDFLEPQYHFPNISNPANALFVDNTIARSYVFSINVYNGTTLVDSLVNSVPFYFIKASRQILENPLMNDFSTSSLLPFIKPLLVNDYKVICWKGYPIDVQFDALGSTAQSVVSGSNYNINASAEDRMLRFCLIDSLGNEYTNLSTTANYEIQLNTSLDIAFIIDYRVPTCEGKYFRFTNINGGQEYWLFDNVSIIEPQRQNKSRVQRNYNNLTTARSRDVSLGNEVTKYLLTTYTTNSEEENRVLTALIDSPIIELWEGGNQWRRVELTNSNGSVSSKQVSTNFSFTFDLGKIYNQSY